MHLTKRRQISILIHGLLIASCSVEAAFASSGACVPQGKRNIQDTAASRKEHGVLKIGMSELPESWDPRAIWNYQHAMLLPSVFQTLVRLDKSGNLVGELAESWEFKDGGKSLVIHLKKGALFHDGSPVKADDVVFSLSRVFWNDDESSVAYLRDVFTGADQVPKDTILSSFKAVGDREVHITLPKPYVPLLHVLSMAEFGIYSHSAFKKGQFLGSGPLQPKNVNANQVQLRRDCNYKSDSLKLDEIDVLQIKGSLDAADQIKAGKLDVAVGVYDADLDSVKAGDIEITRLRSFAIRHLYLNSKSPVLAKREVREALKAVIQKIVSDNGVRFSFESPNQTYLPLGVLPPNYYSSQSPGLTYEGAKDLLKKHSSGQMMRILLRKGSNHPALAEALNRELASVGFKIDASLRTPTQIKAALDSGEFEMSRSDYFGMFPDPDGLLEAVSSLKHVNSSTLLSSLSRTRGEADPKIRLKHYSDAFSAWEKEVPVIPLYQISLPVMHSKNVTLPATDFRFASDLWRVFWKAN